MYYTNGATLRDGNIWKIQVENLFLYKNTRVGDAGIYNFDSGLSLFKKKVSIVPWRNKGNFIPGYTAGDWKA